MALPARLFCDTSFFYACFDQDDVNHRQADDLSKDAAASGSGLYVTWDISGISFRRFIADLRPSQLERIVAWNFDIQGHDP